MNDTTAHLRSDEQPALFGGLSQNEVLSRDEVLDALAKERRRTVLAVTSREDLPIDVSTLARAVTNEENAGREGATRQEIEIQLWHVDLPKLADVGLIRYDRDEAVITDAVDVDLLE